MHRFIAWSVLCSILGGIRFGATSTRTTMKHLTAGLGLAFVIGSALAGQPNTSVTLTAESQYTVGDSSFDDPQGIGSIDKLGAFGIGTEAGPFLDVTASAGAVVKGGLIGAVLGGEAQATGDDSGVAQGNVQVTYKDTLTYDLAQFPIGMVLKIHQTYGIFGKVSLDVAPTEGSQIAHANAGGGVTVGLEAAMGSQPMSYQLVGGYDVGGSSAAFDESIVTQTDTIVNGQSYVLYMQIGLAARAFASDMPAYSPSDDVFAFYSDAFQGTVAWGGITAAFDEAGNPIPIPEITSASGIDYNQSFIPPSDLSGSVPDTANTLALISLSLIGFVLVSRRSMVGLR